MAHARGLLSLEPLPDCGELEEIGWLDMNEVGALNLAGITRYVLQDVALRLDDPARPAHFSAISRQSVMLARVSSA